ncbi:MAG: DUF401 family protein [Thermodesulfobacteriota bacterium]
MITGIPVLVKTLIVFFMVLALNRIRLKLSTSLFAGAVMLGVWTGMGPYPLAKSLASNLAGFDTVNLVVVVGLILVISRLLKDSGQLDRIVSRFGALSRDPRMVGAAMPALIGLLPMPGGALFSAPMVDTAFCETILSKEKKTVVNYWFRHIWEYWWPLYPGVILAVGLLQVEIWQFMAVMLPMTGVTVLAGVVFILRPMGITAGSGKAERNIKALGKFLREIMPIIVVVAVIALMAVITMTLRIMGFNIALPGGTAILPGLLAALIWVVRSNRIPLGRLWAAMTNREILPMVLLVVSIMLFKGVMTDSHAVSHIRDELVSYRFPLIWIILLMPFLSGLVTGIAIGFVGTSFPLIIPLFPDGSPVEYLSYACLAYTFGYMGMMLSPVHLCFLVTKDYFRASLFRSYRPLALPVITVLGSGWIYFLLLRYGIAGFLL